MKTVSSILGQFQAQVGLNIRKLCASNPQPLCDKKYNKNLSKTSVCKQIYAWHILIFFFFWMKILVCLLDLILYVLVNTFLVMSGWFFMG